MKKLSIFLFAIVCAGTIFGQKLLVMDGATVSSNDKLIKEVAIMKPYIMGGATVPENDKLIMVGAMEESFTKIDGYKAFSRFSQKLIDAEMVFQRSGAVDDNQIKDVGKQTGVSYICTFTLAIEGNELVIKSNIIDVVTAEIINSKTVVCLNRLNREDIIEKCESLPYKLLNVNQGSSGGGNTPSGGSSGSGAKRNGEIWNPDGVEMVYVEGTGSGALDMKSFFIGKYEVTQTQWQAIMGSNPSATKNPNHPVHNVNYDDVQAFIKKLNEQTGRNYRLPSKIEWLYAAHGGKNKETYKYAGSDNYDEVGWFAENSSNTGSINYSSGDDNEREIKWGDNYSYTHPVGMKKPNSLGLYDMSGNVAEMCSDMKYDEHICMGAMWRRNVWMAYAQLDTPDNYISNSNKRSSHNGFRLVLVP